MGLKMLYDMVPPGIHAKDEDNPLIFWTGPLTAADVPGPTNLSLATVNFNNDLTAGRSHTHGDLGINLKRAGYDGLIITGKSEKPVYLFINEQGVKIRDAGYLWGKDTHETEEILKGELGPSVSVGAIGPVGENLCAGGMMCNDRNHNMAHSGAGSALGAKKIKAIATQGSKSFPIAHPEQIADIRKRWVQLIMAGHRYGRSRHGMHFKNEFVALKDRIGLAGKNYTINQFYSFSLGLSKLNRRINFFKKSFSALHLKGHRNFSGGQRTSPLVPFAPHPDPPPRRGEGRAGVMS
jgi:aldehyde:ferredoxin oxidoreductase